MALRLLDRLFRLKPKAKPYRITSSYEGYTPFTVPFRFSRLPCPGLWFSFAGLIIFLSYF